MSNQNKKTSNFFWAKNLENSCFFVKSSSNAPTGVDRKTQNEKKVILDQFCIPIYHKIWNMMQKSDSIFRLT